MQTDARLLVQSGLLFIKMVTCHNVAEVTHWHFFSSTCVLKSADDVSVAVYGGIDEER